MCNLVRKAFGHWYRIPDKAFIKLKKRVNLGRKRLRKFYTTAWAPVELNKQVTSRNLSDLREINAISSCGEHSLKFRLRVPNSERNIAFLKIDLLHKKKGRNYVFNVLNMQTLVQEYMPFSY